MRRNRERAAAIGVRKALGAIAKQVRVAAREREQALFRLRVRFDRTVDAHMPELRSALGECPADQEAAMAVERVALVTQETDAVARALIHDSRQAGRKFPPRGHGL